MSEDQVANVVNVFAVIVGMVLALIAGYSIGYRDAKRHMEKDK
jgi:ABC-type dipeptide/oligopeptide/nickel transport system permease subunit